jgi:hypothetical protein
VEFYCWIARCLILKCYRKYWLPQIENVTKAKAVPPSLPGLFERAVA